MSDCFLIPEERKKKSSDLVTVLAQLLITIGLCSHRFPLLCICTAEYNKGGMISANGNQYSYNDYGVYRVQSKMN